MRNTLAVLGFVLLGCGTSDGSGNEPDAATGSTSDGGRGDGGGGTKDGGGTAPPLGEPQTGVATYYAANGGGNCSFDPTPNDLDVAAMNHEQYAGSAACGACAAVQGLKGKVTVRIVDQCPECARGHLDLSKEAFAKIATVSDGRVPITWQTVACNISGNVGYHYKDGSSQYWTAIQVRNHRVPIRKLEIKTSSGFVEAPRQDYNYFVLEKGAGPGPVTVRVTAIDGQTLEDTLPAASSDATVSGKSQFK
ncbi:hypothetical protein LVJ94_00625 [Pendulispora rubella]|uniref:Expansin-like EG45 domain-containing protein n=1 Tax=Pendulispora rubella TaxID=2741070 RepID=A0ABZ2L490_9BACT